MAWTHEGHAAEWRPVVSNLQPLIDLIGAERAQEFALLGNVGAVMVYKHIANNRLLYVDWQGQTFKEVANRQPFRGQAEGRKFCMIPLAEALNHAFKL